MLHATILLAEEEPAVRGVIARLLRDGGFLVAEVSSVEDMFSFLESKMSVDLLLFDPGLLGDRTGEVKEILTARPQLRAVALSGYA